MVPYCVLGKSLGFFFVEHLPVSVIFGWDSCCNGVRLVWRGEGDSSNIDFVGCRSLWCFAGSWNEYGSFCIWGPEYDGELGVVDPPSLIQEQPKTS